VKTRPHFIHRIDMWDDAGENMHLAGVEDFEGAEAPTRGAGAASGVEPQCRTIPRSGRRKSQSQRNQSKGWMFRIRVFGPGGT
jgi:hypothetical protein